MFNRNEWQRLRRNRICADALRQQRKREEHPRPCLKCGIEFRGLYFKDKPQKYCSTKCRDQAVRDRRPIAKCIGCGTAFQVTKDRKKFCSHPCCCRHRSETKIRTKQYVRAQRQKLYYANPQKILARSKKWSDEHPEQRRNYNRRYGIENRIRIRDKARIRMATDLNFKIRSMIASRISDALKRGNARKSSKTVILLGCDIQFLKGYLEARFLPGMNWQNRSHKGWHVDHHIPLAEFDLCYPDQQRQAFHYSNLRPLWGVDNMRKGSKRPPTHQAELI